MAEYVSKDNAMKAGTLCDWYINSIDETVPPVWTEKHIDELLRDFLVIPKETPVVNVPAKHGRWVKSKKHSWRKDKDGELDVYSYFGGMCNGIECKICGDHICVHCFHNWEELAKEEDCREHYECSCCGAPLEADDKTPFCSQCGARMESD